MPELLSNWDLSCGVFIKDKNIFLDCKNAFIFHHFKPKTNLTWHNISFSRSKKDLESDLCCKKCISIKALKTCKKDQSHLYSVVQSTLLKVELKELLFGKINCRMMMNCDEFWNSSTILIFNKMRWTDRQRWTLVPLFPLGYFAK